MVSLEGLLPPEMQAFVQLYNTRWEFHPLKWASNSIRNQLVTPIAVNRSGVYSLYCAEIFSFYSKFLQYHYSERIFDFIKNVDLLR